MEHILLETGQDECLKKLETYLKGMDDASKARNLEALIKYALEKSLPTCTIKALISFCAAHPEINVNSLASVFLYGDEEAFLFLCEKFREDNFFYYEMLDAVANHPSRLETIIEWLKKYPMDILDVSR